MSKEMSVKVLKSYKKAVINGNNHMADKCWDILCKVYGWKMAHKLCMGVKVVY